MVWRGSQGVRRFALGNVTDMGLEEAYQVARELIQKLKDSGENAKLKAVRANQQQEEGRRRTGSPWRTASPFTSRTWLTG